ncbi:MAG TPA: hypothetical protein HPQ00_09065, partial [Magnetococcales bacterium]|nr:hypothetical protein [Magnetococcales bacterium]
MSVSIDLKVIRTPALMLGVAVCLCYGSLWGSGRFREAQEQELRRTELVIREIAVKYDAMAENIRLINTFYPRFSDFERQGIIGEEDRVSWVESVRRKGHEGRIFSLNYSVAPPEPFALPSFGKLVGPDLYASGMSIDMELLHEGEMMDFISGLQADAKGLFVVNECHIERKGKGGRLDRSGW